LRSDVEIIKWPNRYADPRGKVLWEEVTGIVNGTK
jgi:hypothetical protein